MSILPALLCLSQFLGQKTHEEDGTLPRPTIWAEPGPVIPSDSSVTIWCQGSLEAQEYCLWNKDVDKFWNRQKPVATTDKVNFSMKKSYAGRYYCKYRSPTGRSELSDAFKLVRTGFYDKPSLAALPSPVVTSGGNVTLQCASREGVDGFTLIKEGESGHSWTLDSQPHPSGQSQVLFLVGPVTPSHRWMFRCYGYFRKHPVEWSHPSDRLELLVSGPSGGLSPSTTASISTVGSSEDQGGSSRDSEEQSNALVMGPQPGESMELDPQVAAPAAPQEVTYAQLTHLTLKRETSPPPFSPLEQPPAEPTSSPQDHTMENLILLSWAGLMLIGFEALLFQALDSDGRTQDETEM
ncbi:leukocyte immunoglobulin-like receptor subfamily A member 5 [Pteronotus mesoamericanus]|uniref:leukocyte immunoglobulin-like receptor subfamily A member 5 n=1 Tax=Pteronotus mesoamericanus TaxID=1884717 RepID=UPI0023EC1B5E|nr:leukocyte immunoglobulin-like receptor subfamily A member 5 [Pteronotus parnellii mesoamericanus]